MITQQRRILWAAVTALASMIVIGNAGAVNLRKPAVNAVITQNDPTTGCPSNPSYGSGFKIKFGWSPTTFSNFSHYHLLVQRGTATPIIDDDGRRHRFRYVTCGFVIDSNLSGWHWQVTTFDSAGNLLETSELRSFSFAPCRVNGQACFSGP